MSTRKKGYLLPASDYCAAGSFMAADLSVTLSAAESKRFVRALDAPFQPNAKLMNAMVRATRVFKPR